MAPLGELNPNASNVKHNSTTQPSTQPGDENSQVEKGSKRNTKESRKRKSDAVDEPENPPEIDDDDPRIYETYMTPNQVRRKVREFIEGGNMKVGEFQEAICITPTSYQRFMRMTGSDEGSGTAMYSHAFRFFRKRELQGLKAAPKAKKPKKSEAAKKGEQAKQLLDVSDVSLNGEETEEVPVYETCDEVRKKIRAFLRKPDISQQAFCRAISACCSEDRKIQSRQLNAFLNKKGPMEGNTSSAFYGSYVFFEKLRIKDGKPKSQFREEMEKIHRRGVNTTEQERFWICKGNERPYQDKYGQVSFVRTRR
ncbi:hypothetical protein GGR53DRAFT_462752 [Hypoxylon sp. FL1150]|nr:hypothetical protein GGR53DRAFT_462752 [Hypoxylon sp. FL1150]